jgi:hypothetical protein
MKYRSSLFLVFLVLFSSFSVYAQSLKNLEGTYFVTQDSIVHSYEFNKRKLTVRLNINSGCNLQYVYHYLIKHNDDQTLNVYLLKIQSQDVDLNNQPIGKPKNVILKSGFAQNYWSVWTLEKVEDNNLFIKVEPQSIKWPASKGHLANYYSGFEDHFVLQLINI